MPNPVVEPTPSRWTMAGLGTVVFLLLFSRSMTRDLDLDEHQFVAPPLLLLQEGARPYADYPYFHMPGLVYVYAGLFRCSPYPLLTARFLSVVCGMATVLLLFGAGWRIVRRGNDRRTCWVVAGGLAAVFMTSRLFTYTSGWAWNHDTAVLCALGAYLFHARGLRSGRVLPCVIAGFLLAAATSVRLSFAFCFLPFALSVLYGGTALDARRRGLALIGAGLAACVAFVPEWLFLWETPRAFVFGNLEYPRLNTLFYASLGGAGAMTWPGKAYHLVQTFITDPGNAVLFALFLTAVVTVVWNRNVKSASNAEIWLLLGLVAALLVGSWGPTPAQYQYYYQMVPFMVLLVFHAVARRPDLVPRWRSVVGWATVVVVATGLPRWYWPVIRVASPECWTPVAVHTTSTWIAQHTPPGARVLTTDIAVPLETGLAAYPEYAVGRHALHIGPFVSADRRRMLHVAWGEELARVLKERPADAVFFDRRVVGDSVSLIDYAKARGFRPLASPDGNYELWVAPEPDVVAKPEGASLFLGSR